MTLEKRISIARALTIVQIVIMAIITLATLGMAALILSNSFVDGMQTDVENQIIIIIALIVGILAIILSIALPFVVLTALRKRTEAWATAAFVCLIIQIVVGGGLLSVFPIITLVLLLNKEASAYIGMR